MTQKRDWMQGFNQEAEESKEGTEAENTAEGQTQSKSEDFASMLDASFKSAAKGSKKLKVGDKLQGEILVIGKEDVFVGTGTIHDAILHRSELVGEGDPLGELKFKKGDVITVYVTGVKGGDIRVSLKPTGLNISDDIEDAFDMMLPMEGKVAELCNGGFRVSIQGKLAFCPISQMDNVRIEKPEEYIGKKFEFRITQFSERGRNIVVSRRKILDEQKDLAETSFLADHHAGDMVHGKVKRLEKYGAFMELAPGLEGLAHISELSWDRVEDPSQVLTVGDSIPVKILKIETVDGRTRIALSVKQTTDAPIRESRREKDARTWADVVGDKVKVGMIASGKVEARKPFGLFIRLDAGVTGLFPKARMNSAAASAVKWDKLKLGDVVSVQVADINSAEQKIAFCAPGDEVEGDEDWRSYVANTVTSTEASGSGFGSFGGALGDQLKKALENKGKK